MSTLKEALADFERWMSASSSYWQDTVAKENVLPKTRSLPESCETVIVGGGVVGASVAHCLVEAGADPKGIAVLDAARVAFGATGRNAGFSLSYPGPELLDWERDFGREAALELIRANIATRDWVADFVKKTKAPFQAGGSYFAACDAEEGALVSKSMDLLREAGPEENYQLLETLPGPAAGYGTTLFAPKDIGIHPAWYTASLLKSADVAVTPDCAVAPEQAWKLYGDGVRMMTSQGAVEAKRAIFCVNAYLGRYFPELAPALPVPGRNQVVLMEIENEVDNRLWGDGIYYARYGYDYWRQFANGRLLVGGARDKDLEGETTFELSPHEPPLRYLIDELAPRLAGGAKVRELRRWQGIMGLSPDGVPFAGFSRGAKGRVSYAAGFTGYGLGFHRAVADRLVKAIADGASMGPFDSSRFLKTT